MAQEVRNIRRQKLPNGLTVITEQMQHIIAEPVRTLSFPAQLDTPPNSISSTFIVSYKQVLQKIGISQCIIVKKDSNFTRCHL